ncbi:alkaline phosphatase family protein [Natronomonas gomsonensis]|jgi:predicted AlkP superfamily phosphohydrolase/phosphomutase|uniref:alkaline phosphatase family protein n=1 Tax=Natronomonas gomsonensis TaxID=1046043 RepID=UPI0020CA4118|nr:alkaline phosphatase family protein [Natronomonas gomsonensis]MCY4732062.1 alkaline phosphatase family protein [Natronomonas gomsonensis]
MGLFDRLRGGEGPRVAFFGIDGVPYSLIADNEETFPNLTAMANEGAGGAIDSIVPPESSACWPALTTGVNPGETGVYGFQDREVGSYDTYVPMGRDVQATRLWSRVTDAGREATVMNVPVTFPPDRDVQRMVSGFLSPGVEKAAYPDELRETLEGLDYKIDVNAKLGHDEDKSEFVEDAHETLDARFEAFKHYIQQDDWNLFFGVFMTTDRVNHFLFKHYAEDGEYKEEFLEFYEKVDRYLGELRDMLSDGTTMVVASDHGFTKLDHEVKCNVWLEENGWLSYEDDDHDSLDDIADDTKAYSLIPGRFYINLEGREPRGSVPKEYYEEVRAELKAELEALEGPNGRKVADRVVTKEKAFRGDHADIAPDLVVIPNHGFDLKSGFRSGDKVFDIGPRNGMHSFDNACLFVDDDGATIQDADLYDIAPTILELLDMDVDRSEFDGASLV